MHASRHRARTVLADQQTAGAEALQRVGIYIDFGCDFERALGQDKPHGRRQLETVPRESISNYKSRYILQAPQDRIPVRSHVIDPGPR